MRVLHVITSLQTGGVEKLMVDLLPRQKALGVDAEIVLLDGRRTRFYDLLETAGVKVLESSVTKSVYDPRHIMKLRELIDDYDIIHSHNTSPQLFTAIAGNRHDKILITTEHNTFNRRRNWKWFRRIDSWMYRQYDAIVCVSGEVENKLRAHLRQPDDKRIRTIYNGVDTKLVASADQSEEIARLRLSRDGAVLILMVAAFRPQKDHRTLIRSLKYLPENYKVLLVGSGELMEECGRLSNVLGLSERIVFLGQRGDVPELLRSVDVNVLSTHYEGLALAALESMASGKPFVASDVDGLREIGKGTAVLVAPEDPKALAEAILRVTQDKEYRDEVIAGCLNRSKDFDLDKMVRGYVDLYRELMTARNMKR